MIKRLISAFFSVVSPAHSALAGVAPDEQLSGLGMLVFSGKHAEARPLLEAALQQYRRESNTTGEGVTLVLLGITDVAEAKAIDARRRLDDAAVKLREGGDGFSVFLAYWVTAQHSPIGMPVSDALVQSLIEAAHFLWPQHGANVELDIRLFDSASSEHRTDWNRIVELSEKVLCQLELMPDEAVRLFKDVRFRELELLYRIRKYDLREPAKPSAEYGDGRVMETEAGMGWERRRPIHRSTPTNALRKDSDHD